MIRDRLDDGVLRLTLARPEVLNALDIPHLEALLQHLRGARNREAVRCVVLCGEGRAFCVGADIKAMDRMTDAEFAHATSLYQSLAAETRALAQPIIAALNGHTLGGGLELALMADIRIAARSARLGLPDAALGFSPSGGLTWLLNRITGAGRAMHLAMTCEVLDAERALQWGLVTEVVDDEALVGRSDELAAQLTGYPRLAMANIKRSFNAAAESGFADALALEAACDAACYADPETRANLAAFLNSRRR